MSASAIPRRIVVPPASIGSRFAFTGGNRRPAEPARAAPAPRSQALEVLHEVGRLPGRQAERHAGLIVVDDGAEGREAAVVVVATLRALPEPAQWRRPVHARRAPFGLEGVDADLPGRVQVPARL